jgi:hypothetical protein
MSSSCFQCKQVENQNYKKTELENQTDIFVQCEGRRFTPLKIGVLFYTVAEFVH